MTLAKKKKKEKFMSNVENLPEELRALLQHFMLILSLLKHIQPLCCVKHKHEKTKKYLFVHLG